MESSKNIDVLFIIIAGTLAMLLLVSCILILVFLYQKKQLKHQVTIHKLTGDYHTEILQTFIKTQENERKRISQDLHDEVGGMLIAIRYQLLGAMKKVLSKSIMQKDLLKPIEIIDMSILSMHNIAIALLPPTLTEFGLADALEELCLNTNSKKTYVIFSTSGISRRFNGDIEVALYRIAQESINNSLKHAHASEVKVHLNIEHSTIKLIIEDDGKGFEENRINEHSHNRTGFGIKNIESRAKAISAEVIISSNIENGTRIEVILNDSNSKI